MTASIARTSFGSENNNVNYQIISLQNRMIVMAKEYGLEIADCQYTYEGRSEMTVITPSGLVATLAFSQYPMMAWQGPDAAVAEVEAILGCNPNCRAGNSYVERRPLCRCGRWSF